MLLSIKTNTQPNPCFSLSSQPVILGIKCGFRKQFQSAQFQSELKYKMLKIVVVGECGTGKTSIIRRFIHGTFDPASRPTIGANFFQKSFYIQNAEICLQFWDTTGQERLRTSFDIYLKGAAGAIIVEDHRKIQNKEVKRVQEWRELLLEKTALSDGRPIPVILLLNKSDLTPDSIDEQPSSVISGSQIKDVPHPEDSSESGGAVVVSGSISQSLKQCEDEESKQDSQLSDSQSAVDIMSQMQDLLRVNGVFKTSAKDGKKIKVAIACLVREILKEGSFINRLENQDNSNHVPTNGVGKNSQLILGDGAGVDTSELLAPDIKVHGRKRESIQLSKQYNGKKPQQDGGCCAKKEDKCF